MKCMLFNKVGEPLRLSDSPIPTISATQVLITIECCGVCRTDRHIIDGDLKEAKLPLIPGHQIVGHIAKLGSAIKGLKLGDRVGVPWLGSTCGHCQFCSNGEENLCDFARFTGYHTNGGFADFCAAEAQFCFKIPESFSSTQAAPLLCAGLIGYRALQKCGAVNKIGFYGFGASAHILCQIAQFRGIEVYAFTREGDISTQKFALELGAKWAGPSHVESPKKLDAAIIFAADGALVPQALKQLRKGGRLICAGIHMSPITSFPYSDLWGERQILSVANLTRKDGIELLQLAAEIPLHTKVQEYPLEKANEAFLDSKNGRINGAAVLRIK